MPQTDYITPFMQGVQLAEMHRKQQQEEAFQQAGATARRPIEMQAPEGGGTVQLGTEYDPQMHYENLRKLGTAGVEKALELEKQALALQERHSLVNRFNLMNGVDYFLATNDSKGAVRHMNMTAQPGEMVTDIQFDPTDPQKQRIQFTNEQGETVVVQDVDIFRKTAIQTEEALELYNIDQQLRIKALEEKRLRDQDKRWSPDQLLAVTQQRVAATQALMRQKGITNAEELWNNPRFAHLRPQPVDLQALNKKLKEDSTTALYAQMFAMNPMLVVDAMRDPDKWKAMGDAIRAEAKEKSYDVRKELGLSSSETPSLPKNGEKETWIKEKKAQAAKAGKSFTDAQYEKAWEQKQATKK